jgi:hypothetical protein
MPSTMVLQLWFARRAGPCLSVLTLTLLLAMPSQAQTSSITTSVLISGNGGTTNCGQFDSTSSPLFTSCGATFTIIPGDTTSFTGSAEARATFGDLGTGATLEGSCALADPTIVNCQGFAGGNGLANAGFFDEVTVANAPSSGLLALTFTTSGLNQIDCGGLSPCAQGTFARTSYSTGNGWTPVSNGTSSHTLDFGYADGFGDLQLFLESDISCQAGDTFSCGAISNFLDTLHVTGLSALDASGNPITGATFTTGSGTNYNDVLESSPTPEPSSGTLFSIGALVLVGLSLKKSV